mmetsp:Transcript_19321/g.27208  ORF Transcript_19321/g.27208 Transcript_19321/m.27208 type:complete len:189 (+) Transcript_19321:75-641(+)|eukprot:CAMPEP_0185260086 /NCGR_PEP_ID=MMETSP1359-20130426/8733_1 /TAXON_ID=552665 /ORGANISM="Bigelowiella longifila, Strain CCMP242" /LENGTH=188 /DNA_ID=CAMNT_0027846203 /DNA_START=218 /DNA_END=784 /DNA_ORIENTATION=+
MMRTTSLLFSVAINVALVVTLCLQLRSRAELGATMVRSVRPMVAPRVMNPSRVACNAKKAETGMVPDKNTRPDEDIVATDGSFFDKVFNEWITKKSPTRGLVLDRQRQMNEERAENGGFSLPDFSFPEGGSGGGLPEINLEGLSEFSLDPTLKRTVKKTTTQRGTQRGTKKKTTAATQEKKGGFPFFK